jgi:hypothetical protein
MIFWIVMNAVENGTVVSNLEVFGNIGDLIYKHKYFRRQSVTISYGGQDYLIQIMEPKFPG